MCRLAPAPAVSRETVAGADEIVPLRGLRRTIAEKLTRSHQEIPAATCWVDADATELMALLARELPAEIERVRAQFAEEKAKAATKGKARKRKATRK